MMDNMRNKERWKNFDMKQTKRNDKKIDILNVEINFYKYFQPREL